MGPSPRSLSGSLLICLSFIFPKMLMAQSAPNLIPPDQVLLHLHTDLKNTDFVEPLICMLRRVLVSPVEAQSLNLSLGPELLAAPTQLDVARVADKFIRATAKTGAAKTFHYFLIPYDMKDATFRYVFANTFGNASTPYHAGVVSMARLEFRAPDLSRRDRAEIAALRAYKLIIKSVVILSGFPDVKRCVLAFPRSLEELDQKSPEFCPEDRTKLVDARVLRSEEVAGCAYVAWLQ